jgi:hypothetical protein
MTLFIITSNCELPDSEEEKCGYMLEDMKNI